MRQNNRSSYKIICFPRTFQKYEVSDTLTHAPAIFASKSTLTHAPAIFAAKRSAASTWIGDRRSLWIAHR